MGGTYQFDRPVVILAVPRSGSTLLLPPGWHAELGKLSRDRWMAMSYGQQVHEPETTIGALCDSFEVSADRILTCLESGESRLSRYTISPPAADKWHRNAEALGRVLPGLQDTIDCIRAAAPELPGEEFELSIDEARA
jgi:hypothetical protein